MLRFVFLPENSTHMLQPLDVCVFGPMKRRWRQVLADWKADCSRKGLNYTSIPKKVINFDISCTVPYQVQYQMLL